jgi:HSP20 family protein
VEVRVVGRGDPLQELLNLQERINRLFEESLGRGRPEEGAGLGSASWAPLADVYETARAFFVQIELPGLHEDDVEVVAQGSAVTVRGERRAAASMRPDSFYRMERSYGTFTRAFRFGEPIDAERVKAEFRNGLLQIELPKARPRSDWRAQERDE